MPNAVSSSSEGSGDDIVWLMSMCRCMGNKDETCVCGVSPEMLGCVDRSWAGACLASSTLYVLRRALSTRPAEKKPLSILRPMN